MTFSLTMWGQETVPTQSGGGADDQSTTSTQE